MKPRRTDFCDPNHTKWLKTWPIRDLWTRTGAVETGKRRDGPPTIPANTSCACQAVTCVPTFATATASDSRTRFAWIRPITPSAISRLAPTKETIAAYPAMVPMVANA